MVLIQLLLPTAASSLSAIASAEAERYGRHDALAETRRELAGRHFSRSSTEKWLNQALRSSTPTKGWQVRWRERQHRPAGSDRVGPGGRSLSRCRARRCS
jgi:hypothetical protein